MDDLISRQAALSLAKDLCVPTADGIVYKHRCIDPDEIRELPSAQPDVPDRKVGEWDMFELITSVYFGKQYYFAEDNGLVYSRETHKHMTKEDAISEFLGIIGE